jgi:FMN phosphatase YigB (HAD superfamily)
VLTATLSNTNPIHWHSPFNQDVVMPLFDRHFPSFELGRAKPDTGLFEDVIRRLDVDPADVTFLDDKLVNVEAARRTGMPAYQVDGPAAARRALARSPDRAP